MALEGLTNTSTPGSYTSSVSTYDNSATPVVIDGPTASNPVTFDSNSTAITTAVARTLSFVSNTDSMSFLMDPSLGSTSDRTDSTMSLSIATNAAGGYVLTARAGSLSGGGHSLPAISAGTSSCVSPASFSTNRWGYAISAITQGGAGSTAIRQGDLASGYYCGHSPSDVTMVSQSAPTNGDVVPITHRTKIDYRQAAVTYSSTITYTATPSY